MIVQMCWKCTFFALLLLLLNIDKLAIMFRDGTRFLKIKVLPKSMRMSHWVKAETESSNVIGIWFEILTYSYVQTLSIRKKLRNALRLATLSVLMIFDRGKSYYMIEFLLAFLSQKIKDLIKGNSNFELRTTICHVNVEIYFLTIINHIGVPSSKLEFPLIPIHSLINYSINNES